MTSVNSKRLEWVDWMKTMGIYLVILGHFYSIGEKLIYVFHVPLFFLISGLLSKKDNSNSLFWKKLWYNLVVPMFLMAIVNFLHHCIIQLSKGTFTAIDVYWFVRNVAFGMVAGIDTLWFVYTLIIIKIIYQFCYSDKLFYAMSVAMLVLAYVYNNRDFSGYPFFLREPNAIVDICTAYPFFALGILLRNCMGLLNALISKLMLVVVFVFGLFFVILCCKNNGYVGVYCCNYGGNMLLFLVGAFAGSMMIWGVSKLLGCAPEAVSIISRGTIIILGLHKILIDLVRLFQTPSVWDIVWAMLILLLFVPFVVATEKFFPLMAGKYRLKL